MLNKLSHDLKFGGTAMLTAILFTAMVLPAMFLAHMAQSGHGVAFQWLGERTIFRKTNGYCCYYILDVAIFFKNRRSGQRIK
jgi:hypothetical protein